MKTTKLGLLLLFAFGAALPVFAQEKGKGKAAPKAAGAKGDENGVLDFEGDVIEGTRKRPDLFLQTETANLTLDAILYLRKDMNDFHQVERFRRPGYFERKTKEGL